MLFNVAHSTDSSGFTFVPLALDVLTSTRSRVMDTMTGSPPLRPNLTGIPVGLPGPYSLDDNAVDRGFS